LGRRAKNGEQQNRGKAQQEKAKECLWANLTKGRSSILGFGIPSDWPILTGFVNTHELLMQKRNAIWQWSE